jgi:predicted transcriptional regulator
MVYDKSKVKEEIVKELEKRNEPVSIGELETTLNKNRIYIYCILRYLREKGIVKNIGEGKFSKWILTTKWEELKKKPKKKEGKFKLSCLNIQKILSKKLDKKLKQISFRSMPIYTNSKQIPDAKP